MTDAPAPSDPGSPGDPVASGPRCGNCGAPVSASDVMCPVCGVLLAAYEAPSGASSVTAAIQPVSIPAGQPETPLIGPPANEEPPSSSTTAPSPIHLLRSTSPVGDALDRVEASGSSISADAEVAAGDDLASELSQMTRNDSDLAKEVEARLRGAKVRFDGRAPVIESQPEPPASVAPAPSPPPAPSPSQGAATGALRQDQDRLAAEPVAPGRSAPATQPVGSGVNDRSRARPALVDNIIRALPFLLIAIFVVQGFSSTVTIIGGVVMVVIGMLTVIGLLGATSRVGRKTTSMVRDDPSSRRRLP